MSSGNGNTLGGRNWWRYTNDSGDQFRVFIDNELAAAGGFGVITPGPVTLPEFPKRSRMRRLQLVAADGQKKVLPVATNAGIYAANVATDVEIAGKTFTSTSRTGEKYLYAVAK